MSIQINNNFDYKGNQPNFERDRFETLELMRSADERSLDNGHISYCIETGKHYVFNENNDIDVETGKWRLLTENLEDLKSVLNLKADKSELDTKVDKVEGKSLVDDTEIARLATINNYDDTQVKTQISNINKTIGDIDGLTIVGVKDLVNAVNKLDLSFMQSIVYNTKDGKKLLTITYKNGNTTDIDITAIITNTNIGELANVEDTGITDKQVLGYNSSTGKYIPITIDNNNVLQEAKEYTDKQINAINRAEGKVVDSKPTIVNNGDGTYNITYIKGGVSVTTTDTNIWFYYKKDGALNQTLFIDGVELTIDNAGSVDFTKYVNKTTDLASGFTGSEIDKTKVTTIKELDDLLTLVNTSLSKKVNTSDIIDDCLHTDIDKPVSARVAKELKNKIEDITISVSGSGSVVLNKTFENVTANSVNKFDSPLPLDNACMINVYKLQSGNTNLNDSLKALENNTKQDFIKNDDEIVIDDKGAKIKDSYEYNSILNSNGFYESKIINKNNYLEILGIEVIY